MWFILYPVHTSPVSSVTWQKMYILHRTEYLVCLIYNVNAVKLPTSIWKLINLSLLCVFLSLFLTLYLSISLLFFSYISSSIYRALVPSLLLFHSLIIHMSCVCICLSPSPSSHSVPLIRRQSMTCIESRNGILTIKADAYHIHVLW